MLDRDSVMIAPAPRPNPRPAIIGSMWARKFLHKAERKKGREGAAPSLGSSGFDETEAFTSQARWLLEWHNKRSDGFESRAVAILGFSGVILALLPTGLGLSKGLKLTSGIKYALFVTAALLLVTAICCVMVLAPRRSSAAQIEQLRQQWKGYSDGWVRGVAQQNIAESLLHGKQARESSPLERSFVEANVRGHWFALAMYVMLASLTALATVVVQVFWQL
jgi:hypothetical protein